MHGYISYDPSIKDCVGSVLYVIFFSNAIINPLVYGWMSKDFNMAYRKLLHLQKKSDLVDRSISKTASTFVSKQSLHYKSSDSL